MSSENKESLESVEHQLLEALGSSDSDFEYLRDTDEYKVDSRDYHLVKTYPLLFNCPEFFNAYKDLQKDGYKVEPQISLDHEKIALIVTKTISRSENAS